MTSVTCMGEEVAPRASCARAVRVKAEGASAAGSPPGSRYSSPVALEYVAKGASAGGRAPLPPPLPPLPRRGKERSTAGGSAVLEPPSAGEGEGVSTTAASASTAVKRERVTAPTPVGMNRVGGTEVALVVAASPPLPPPPPTPIPVESTMAEGGALESTRETLRAAMEQQAAWRGAVGVVGVEAVVLLALQGRAARKGAAKAAAAQDN
jgi:hypothetical protein